MKEKYAIADKQYQEAKDNYEKIKTEYEKLEQDIESCDARINEIRESMSQSAVNKNRLESQIEILNEQIRSAEQTDEHMQSRLNTIDKDKEEKISLCRDYETQKSGIEEQILAIESEKKRSRTGSGSFTG